MSKKSFVCVALPLLLVAGVGLAAVSPVAVSPGDSSRLALVEGRCPAFSWGAVPGALGYELVAYQLAEQGEEAQPVLRETFAGSASSWTPSLDRCLERGGRYAWTVRSAGGEKAADWSAPNLFQVASSPSEAELEAALDVVRSYLDAGDGAASSPGAVDETAAESEPEAGVEAFSPLPSAVGTTQLSVDGGIEATSFSGDGSAITNLLEANISDLVHTTDTNAGTECGTGKLLDGDGICVAIPSDTDTSAATLCASGQVLGGASDGCVSKVGLNEISCQEGQIPVYESQQWVCADAPTVTVVTVPITFDDANITYAHCPPSHPTALAGGFINVVQFCDPTGDYWGSFLASLLTPLLGFNA